MGNILAPIFVDTITEYKRCPLFISCEMLQQNKVLDKNQLELSEYFSFIQLDI
mgnify:CR=1 FL=1